MLLLQLAITLFGEGVQVGLLPISSSSLGDTIGARIAWQKRLEQEAESLRRTKRAFEARAAAYAALGDQHKALAIVDEEVVRVEALNM